MSEQPGAHGPDELRRQAVLHQIAGLDANVGALAQPLALIAAMLGSYSVIAPASPTLLVVGGRPRADAPVSRFVSDLLSGAGVNVTVIGADQWHDDGQRVASDAIASGAQLVAVTVDVEDADEQAAMVASLLGAGEPATLAPPRPTVAEWTRSALRIRDAVAHARFRAVDPSVLAVDAGAPAIAAAAHIIVQVATAGIAVMVDGPAAATAALVADALDGRVRPYTMVADTPGDRIVDAVAGRLGLLRIDHAPVSGDPGLASALAVGALDVAADLVVAASERGRGQTAVD
jgi:Phosphoribosyltransferase